MTLKVRVGQDDRQIAAIRMLIDTGMKMLVRNQEQINSLVAAQKRTDAALRVYIVLKGSGNGYTKRKVDVQ